MSVQNPKNQKPKNPKRTNSSVVWASPWFCFICFFCFGAALVWFFCFFWFLACGWVRMSVIRHNHFVVSSSASSSSARLSKMVSVDASNISLKDAIQATELVHVPARFARSCVRRPDATGSVLITDLPRKDLDPASSNFKHVLDLVLDISAAAVDMDTIKAIIRDKAWQELPDFMHMKERPVFECACQYFFLLQSDDKICMLKHIPRSVLTVIWNHCAGARTFSQSLACRAWHPPGTSPPTPPDITPHI